MNVNPCLGQKKMNVGTRSVNVGPKLGDGELGPSRGNKCGNEGGNLKRNVGMPMKNKLIRGEEVGVVSSKGVHHCGAGRQRDPKGLFPQPGTSFERSLCVMCVLLMIQQVAVASTSND